MADLEERGQSGCDDSSPTAARVLWQPVCPQPRGATGLGLRHSPGQLLAHCGLLRPSSSKTPLMAS